MTRLARIFAAVLLTAPIGAAAMSSIAWNFRGDPGDWRVSGALETRIGPDGLRISGANGEGVMFTELRIDKRVDALRVTAVTAIDTELKLLWQPEGEPEGTSVELPFILTANDPTVEVDLTKWAQWTPTTPIIGIAFPPGTDLTIQAVELIGWNPLERLEEAIFSIWTFDTFRAYSINFLWGPVVVTSPVARAELFDNLPPFGFSANDILYAAIAVAGLLAAGAALARSRKTGVLTTAFVAVVAGSWVLYDIRMSAEILSYANTDLQTYVFAEDTAKTFRLMQDFWPMTERVKPLIEKEKAVVFVAGPDIPVLSFFRYGVYPVAVQSIDTPREGPMTWVLYRTDAAIDDERRLVLGGSPVSRPGETIASPWPDTILFRELP